MSNLMRPHGPVLLSLLAASTLACSDYSYTPIGEDERSDDAIAIEDVPEMASSYGAIVSSAVTLCKVDQVPCPEAETLEISARFQGLVQVEQEGAAVSATLSACEIDLLVKGEDYKGTDYIDLPKLGTLLRFEGGFTMSEEGPLLNSGMTALIIGAQLSDDVGEDFPTDEDDARVFDQDRDGKVGVSADAPVGKVFLGARVILDMAMSAAEDGSYAGPVNGHDFDLSVFDDSVPFINVGKKVREALEPLQLISQSHDIEMAPGLSACSELAAM